MLACTDPCASMPPQLGAKQIPSQSHMNCRLGRGFCRWHGICHGHVLVLAGILIIDSRLATLWAPGACSRVLADAALMLGSAAASEAQGVAERCPRSSLICPCGPCMMSRLQAHWGVGACMRKGCSTFRRQHAPWTVLSCFGRYAGLGGCWVW